MHDYHQDRFSAWLDGETCIYGRLTPPSGCYLLSKVMYSTQGVLKHKYAQNGGVGECQTTFHGTFYVWTTPQLTLSHMISTARLRGAVEGTGLSSAIILKRHIHQ